MKPETIEKLKKLAKNKAWHHEEDFNAFDYGGGNFDDAYWGGHNGGMIDLAVEILEAEGTELDK